MKNRLLFFSLLVGFWGGLLQAGEAPVPRVIVIDAGHGGKDPGTMNRRTREKDIALAIAKKAGMAIKKRFASTVYYTRLKDQFVSLEGRDRIANRHQCDFFLSFHVNAAANKKAAGVELYYLNNASDRASAKLANRENQAAGKALPPTEAILSGLIQNASTEDSAEAAGFMKQTLQKRLRHHGVKGVRVKTALFYILVGAKCPSLLVETGFLTNPKEERLLRKASYQRDLAEAVAQGLEQYFQSLDRPKSDL